MKAKVFEELLTSVHQLGEIRRSERKPSRSRTFKPADMKAVRAHLGQSQSECALRIGVSVATLRNWAAVVEALHGPRRRGAE